MNTRTYDRGNYTQSQMDTEQLSGVDTSWGSRDVPVRGPGRPPTDHAGGTQMLPTPQPLRSGPRTLGTNGDKPRSGPPPRRSALLPPEGHLGLSGNSLHVEGPSAAGEAHHLEPRAHQHLTRSAPALPRTPPFPKPRLLEVRLSSPVAPRASEREDGPSARAGAPRPARRARHGPWWGRRRRHSQRAPRRPGHKCLPMEGTAVPRAHRRTPPRSSGFYERLY